MMVDLLVIHWGVPPKLPVLFSRSTNFATKMWVNLRASTDGSRPGGLK